MRRSTSLVDGREGRHQLGPSYLTATTATNPTACGARGASSSVSFVRSVAERQLLGSDVGKNPAISCERLQEHQDYLVANWEEYARSIHPASYKLQQTALYHTLCILFDVITRQAGTQRRRMRHQIEQRRDSKTFLVVDEDCGIPTSLVESHRSSNDSGPLAPSDPRSYLLSMSEYDKAQSYEVYDYQTATRPEQGQHAYSGFTHPTYANDYVATQAQVPSGLPQSSSTVSLGAAAQPYGTHDPTYYGQQAAHYPAYLEPPRPVPQIVNVSPRAGPTGTQVTVYFQSPYDFDAPQVTPFIMFGSKRCESILTKTPNSGFYEYTLTTTAPSPASTNSPTAQVPLHLILDDTNVAWEGSPSLDVGLFTYQDQPTYYQLDSPQMSAQAQLQPPRKRKLSPESVPDIYQNRQFSQMSDYSSYAQIPSQQYHRSQATPSMQASQSPSWSYAHGLQTTRSPSDAVLSTASKSSQLLPSPAAGHAPPLIRTSTLQGSPTTPGAHIPATAIASAFNPYAMYPSNAKAMLKIEGDLNSMSDKWTAAEWEARRRLVQFRRSQSGSIISATFEPVTLEDRLPNSICVSCIWWEEKQECYVTSVDTISLLESLVAVRFTVEEKNRIRRNLEGFRPATVSKTKADSEEFFKLIMGFPNPKPRNIEKDVKVFPWRILATALKKIIGKYASHPCMHMQSALSSILIHS
ncbi:hypothetical protein AC578_8630 [Pseudocercospora eumusae]|uniref:DUF7082 domain-containing protein n=1 Tax=Pseudocercospora eumusae TaxID=321146 RepID=A0A139HQ49_9PEZI|nr:hypothetical protein AC578_8630 [Pseudocercospora eumusae]